MKRLVFAALLALGMSACLPAQQSAPFLLANASQPAALSTDTRFNFTLVPELAVPSANAVAPLPAAQPAIPNAPAPQNPNFGDDDSYRWEVGLGYEFIHFKSAPFSANLSGLHSDVAYNLNDWFALEGNVVSAWGGKVLGGETSKYVLFTGGGRVGWGPTRRRWSPWAHALIGGAHLNPQVAGESKNGFAVQLGGGADYRWRGRVSFRAEGDYVRTQLYSTSQNNFQFGAGVVLHF
jgi:opacity protein-like surface antigen